MLADQRFAKNPSMEFVFRTSIFFYVFMNTRYISVIQITISSKATVFPPQAFQSIRQDKKTAKPQSAMKNGTQE